MHKQPNILYINILSYNLNFWYYRQKMVYHQKIMPTRYGREGLKRPIKKHDKKTYRHNLAPHHHIDLGLTGKEVATLSHGLKALMHRHTYSASASVMV